MRTSNYNSIARTLSNCKEFRLPGEPLQSRNNFALGKKQYVFDQSLCKIGSVLANIIEAGRPYMLGALIQILFDQPSHILGVTTKPYPCMSNTNPCSLPICVSKVRKLLATALRAKAMWYYLGKFVNGWMQFAKSVWMVSS